MPGIDNRRRMAVLFGVAGIVLLFVSFVLPWWGWHRDSEGSASGFGYGVSISSGISAQGSGTSFYIGTVTSTIFFVAAILIILAIICTALMVTNLIIDSIRDNIHSNLSMQFGVMALVFCLLAPIVFMFTFPVAMRTDAEREAEADGDEYEVPDHDDPTKSFFGSHVEEDSDFFGLRTTSTNWGGDIGWYLSLLSSVFLILSVIMMVRPRKQVPYSPQAQPMGPVWHESQPQQQIGIKVPPPPSAPPPSPPTPPV